MIYYVEDDDNIRGLTLYALRQQGIEAEGFASDSEFKAAVARRVPDAVLLDIMLPDTDGLEIMRRLRADQATATVPIMMLTAKDSELDKVLGLELGADDYVTKPFSNRELVARVKANLRREAAIQAPAEEENTDIKVGDITIHPEAYTVTKRGENINLTHREFELLHYLAQHIGQVINREHLLQTVWGYDYFGDVRTVDVTVRRLREKIEDNPSQPQWLITRRGVGYYLANPDQN